jgi:two-component system, OmpR family, response regulator
VKRRIRLVDDEISLTRALALYLTENGECDVRIENAGTRAVAAAREFEPDLIFLDILMPDTDGGTLASDIQADPLLRGTPVVFHGARLAGRNRRRAEADRRVSVSGEAGPSGGRARVHPRARPA